MKIEITLNQETKTESGRIVGADTYIAEYNQLKGVHGYDSSDIDIYDSLRLNDRLINKAIIDAEENDIGQNILNGSAYFKGKGCSIKLFTNRT